MGTFSITVGLFHQWNDFLNQELRTVPGLEDPSRNLTRSTYYNFVTDWQGLEWKQLFKDGLWLAEKTHALHHIVFT